MTVLLVSFAIIYVIKKSQNDIEEENEVIKMQNDTFVLYMMYLENFFNDNFRPFLINLN